MTTIFIGSSTSAKSQAKSLIVGCASPDIKFLPWWEQFTAGRTLLQELSRIRNTVNKALLVLTPDLETTIKKSSRHIPNLNVLFEFGYFYSALGEQNVAIVKYGEIYLPSDLDGYIHIFGSSGFRRGVATKTGQRTKAEFQRWLKGTSIDAPDDEYLWDLTRNFDGFPIVLYGDIKATTKVSFQPPIEILIEAKTDSTNLRMSYAADEVIFNWEVDQSQLRVDGGPAHGAYLADLGRIPKNKFVTIRWVVEKDRQRIYVDGELRFDHSGDYSKIDNPVSIFPAHGSVVTLKSLKIRKLR